MSDAAEYASITRGWLEMLRDPVRVQAATVALEKALVSARADGFAAAREQAAALSKEAGQHWCDPYTRCTCDWQSRLDGLPDDIRAMQDGEGTCTACGHAHHDDNVCRDCKPGHCIRDDS